MKTAYYNYSDNSPSSFEERPVVVEAIMHDMQKLIIPDISCLLMLKECAQQIVTNFRQLVLVGMGASINVPRMIACIAPSPTLPIFYLDTTDPLYFGQLSALLDLKHCCFIICSQSGETLEVLALTRALCRAGVEKQQFYFITRASDSKIRRLATGMGSEIIPCDDKVSGRFNAFGTTALLVGLLAGLDMSSMINSANDHLKQFQQKPLLSPPMLAAKSIMQFHRPILVNISYHRQLEGYLKWHNQLMSESLGKSGRGYAIINSFGPEDHHSSFQLYLDGPKDKVYSFLLRDKASDSPLEYLHHSCAMAALSCFHKTNLTTRCFTLRDMGEEVLAGLIVHSLLETIILAHFLELNPFDQPAVEQLKKANQAMMLDSIFE